MNYNLRLLARIVWMYVILNLKNAMEFRFDFVAHTLAEFSFMLISFIFAQVLVSAVPNLGLSGIELFIYATTLDVIFTFGWISRSPLNSLIMHGTLNNFLVRPINPVISLYLNNFNTKLLLINLVKTIFLISFVIVFLNLNIVFYLLFVIISSIISLILTQAIYYVTRSFDLKKIESGSFFYNMLNLNTFQRMGIDYPIYLFPKFILIYLGFFPFYYVATLTINLLKGPDTSLIILLLVIELGLAVFFAYLANWSWKKMLKHYEGFGG